MRRAVEICHIRWLTTAIDIIIFVKYYCQREMCVARTGRTKRKRWRGSSGATRGWRRKSASHGFAKMRTREIICFDLGRCVPVEHALAPRNQWQSCRKEAFASFTACSVPAWWCTTQLYAYPKATKCHTQRCHARKSLFWLCHLAFSSKNTA